MRQAGIVAAAGLYALDHNVERLAHDHRVRGDSPSHGRSEAFRSISTGFETNFVQVHVAALGLGDVRGARAADRGGVLLSRTMRAGVLRAVTHLDVDDDDIDGARSSSFRAPLELWLPAPEQLDPGARADGRRAAGRPAAVRAGSGRAQGRDPLVRRGRHCELRRRPRGHSRHAVPHRLDHEDVHSDGDHAAPGRRVALDLDDRLDRTSPASRTAPRRSAACSRTCPACSARRGRCS